MKQSSKRRDLRYSNYYFSLRGVFENLCAGGTLVFVSFALSIGVQREKIGLITTVASAACVLQMLALFVANHVRSKKRFVVLISIAEPLLLIGAVAAIPFVPLHWRFPVLIGAVFVAAAALHLTKPFTDGWMASIIPAGIRGRYLGGRIQWITISTIAATLAAGFLLQFSAAGSSVTITTIITIGALFGILAALQLRAVEMPVLAATSQISLRDVWSVISGRYRRFHRYLAGTTIFLVPFYLAIPYYQVFYLRVLEMPEGTVAMMQSGYFVVKILLMRSCGRLIDRYGIRAMMLVAGVLYTVFFGCFPFNQPGRYWPLLLCWLIAAPADGLFGVAVTSALYASVPSTSNRNVFFAVSNLLMLGGYGLGALVAIPILARLRTVNFVWGTVAIGQFQVYYAICAILMALCTVSALLIAPARKAKLSS